MHSRGGKITIGLVVLCLLLGGGYVAIAALGPSQTTTDARPTAGDVATPGVAVMVRAVDPSSPTLNGRVFTVADGKVQRRSGDLACERVYYAAGHGICMGVAASGVDYTAK